MLSTAASLTVAPLYHSQLLELEPIATAAVAVDASWSVRGRAAMVPQPQMLAIAAPSVRSGSAGVHDVAMPGALNTAAACVSVGAVLEAMDSEVVAGPDGAGGGDTSLGGTDETISESESESSASSDARPAPGTAASPSHTDSDDSGIERDSEGDAAGVVASPSMAVVDPATVAAARAVTVDAARASSKQQRHDSEPDGDGSDAHDNVKQLLHRLDQLTLRHEVVTVSPCMHATRVCPSCLTVVVVMTMTRADATERRHWQ